MLRFLLALSGSFCYPHSYWLSTYPRSNRSTVNIVIATFPSPLSFQQPALDRTFFFTAGFHSLDRSRRVPCLRPYLTSPSSTTTIDGEVDGPSLLLAGENGKTLVRSRTLSGTAVALPHFSQPSSVCPLIVCVCSGPPDHLARDTSQRWGGIDR